MMTAGLRTRLGLIAAGLLLVLPAPAATVTAIYNAATDVPVTTGGYTATGNDLSFTLNYEPTVGTELMVVKNTGLGFITGAFSNLAQGQAIALSYNGTTYDFVANYYGGSGNDLVLVWASTRTMAWGENVSGQLGDETTTARNVAVRIAGALVGKTILRLAAGTNHTLALCSDGSLVTWGRNVEGQVGDGSGLQRNSPIVLPTAGTPLAGKTVIGIAAGSSHNLVLCSDGTLAAWGYNDFGQVGDDTTTQRNVPVAVVTAGTPLAGKTVVAIAAGVYHSLALCSDGTVATWGWNQQGQLGDNTNTQRPKPVALVTTGTPLAGKTVTAIAGGWGQSLALCSDGTLAAWGMVGFGVYSNLPVQFDGTGALAGKSVAAIAAGYNHSLVLCSDGTVAGWGVSFTGQLGNGGSGSSDVPVAVSTAGVLSGKSVVSLAAGYSQGYARCSDGTLVAWGNNTAGQLGDGTMTDRLTPVIVNTSLLAAGEKAVSFTSGPYAYHALVVTGAAPAPEIAVYTGASTSPADVRQNNTGLHRFPVTSVGGSSSPQTFTIRNAGTVDLTGLALGQSGANPGDFVLSTLGGATLAPGATATFTVTFSPTVSGTRSASVEITSNDSPRSPFLINLVGNDTLTATFNAAADLPVTAASFSAMDKILDLSLNFAPVTGADLMVVKNTGPGFITGTFSNLAQGQAVALSYAGQTYNFVANYFGGNGNDLVLSWAAVRPMAWGLNSAGQLGDGTYVQRNAPIPTVLTGGLAGRSVVKQAAGQSHSLALCSDGTLVAWGFDDHGQLGRGGTGFQPAPVAVTTAGTPLAGKTVVNVAAGASHSLALCSDGTLVTWGNNSFGQLGDNTTIDRSLPVAVKVTGTALAGKSVVGIAAGYLFSLALCSDGTVAAWGYNANGQLGNGTGSQSNIAVPVSTAGVLAGKAVVSLSSNVNHTLALCADGTVVSWGFNFAGELGDGTTTNRFTPVGVTTAGTVLSGRTVVALAAGEHHSLALCSDGTLASWGQNSSGQLGDGSTSDHALAAAVVGSGSALAGRTVVAIAAGTSHSVALCSDGTLVAWGKNVNGELGDGTTTQRTLAVSVGSASLAVGERFIRVAGGSFAEHNVALVASGSPEIAVFEGNGTGGAERQSNAGTFAFASTLVGNSSALQTFTVQNAGTTTLTGLAVTKAGAQPGDFTAGAVGAASLAPGATTTFSVTFSPTASGARSALLQIASNDADENPFLVNVTGTGITPQEAWRQTYFGSPANAGNGSDSADPDLDGLPNLVEYALGLDPMAASTTGLPTVTTTGTDWVYTYTRPTATTELTYTVEISTNLVDWTLVPTVHEFVTSSGGVETWHALYPLNAAARIFFRLKVTAP